MQIGQIFVRMGLVGGSIDEVRQLTPRELAAILEGDRLCR